MKLSVIKQRGLWWTISLVLVLASVVAMAFSFTQYGAPLRPGLDFTGGTRLLLERDCAEADCQTPIELSLVRSIIAEQGIESSSLQLVGTTTQDLSAAANRPKTGLAIRTPSLDGDQRTALQSALAEAIGPFDPEAIQIDTVAPILGQQLLTQGLEALLVAFAGITVYLSLRFKPDYAVLSLVALMHDVLLTLGVFAVLGLTVGYEADSLFLVSLLTIVGFSVNDTVVIYDRIRESLKLSPEKPIDEIVDLAVNQTLARSVNTTLTTVLPLLAIVVFGGATLKFFAMALIIGFLAGAYSSIFIASTLLAWWRGRNPQPMASVELPSE
ncbi:MAG: protein translocase subunit SecF [Cyanobacteria bacterium J06632_22]